MSATMRAPIAPIGWSIALHAVLAGLLIFGLSLPKRADQPVILPIDAFVVDDAVLQAAGRKREDRQRIETERQERAAAEAEEKRQEEERLLQEQHRNQAEETARVEAAQKAKSEADAKVQAAADAKRRAEKESAVKAAAEKKRATQEQRDREAREADLRARLKDEETRSSAGFQSLKASYVRAIQVHVEQRWFEPPGLATGLSCTIYVTQIPGGDVVGTRFGTCNGNVAARQSIENAVRNASPLPPPPEPALFEREVELVFTPKESRR
jgi:colicin import membrane protein